MPITPSWPGVYIEELASGVRTITGVSTSITAFVGYTANGPLDEPIRIFSFGDFERHFGGLHRDSLVSYAARQFFLNGGSDAYVVRVATGAQAARVTLKDEVGNEVMDVEALSAGAVGNGVRLQIDYDTRNPDSLFNLWAVRYELQNGKIVEVESEPYRNLSMNEYSATYAPSVVRSASQLIRLSVRDNLTADEDGCGYSLSGNLSNFPWSDLTENDRDLTCVLNSEAAFQYTLRLSDDLPVSIDALVEALNKAINADANLVGKLEAKRANADGTNNAPPDGTFLKLQSLSTELKSAVRVLQAPVNGLAAKLQLGLEAGGREKEAASARRPAANGTLSSDMAATFEEGLQTHVILDLKLQDYSTGSMVETNLGSVTVPANTPDLRSELENQVRSKVHPAARSATVERWHTRLRVLPGTAEPNYVLFLSHDAAFGFPDGLDDRSPNVRQYSLGVGATAGAQTGAAPGSDGVPPDADTLKGSYDEKTGIYALRDVDLFNLLAIPDATWGLKNGENSDAAGQAVLQEAAVFCEQERSFLLIDPPPQLGSPGSAQTIDDVVSGLQGWMQAVSTNHAAIYFPCIQAADPLDEYRARNMPASGAIAGVMARTDSGPGVWKAPAGTEAAVRGVQALGYHLTDPENGVLNKLGINCLRTFPAYGSVVWGARTLEGSDQQQSDWKYIPVRRLALYIEESLYRGTQWVVFEPNDEPLWAQIRLNVGAFMHNLFRQRAFQGMTPRQAYFVKCDKETTTQNDINLGIVNILVGFAPLKPAEFVIIKIQQIAGQIQT